MTLSVLEPVRHDGTQGMVQIESDITEDFSLAIQELQNGAAKNLAIEAAAKAGLADPRCSGMNQFPYPVDASGETVADPREQTITKYRIDIPVTRKLV